MSVGYTRKELGKLHKQYYEDRMAKNSDKEAFQRALMSMLKAMIDVIDANNQKIEDDIKSLIKDEVKSYVKNQKFEDDIKDLIKDEVKVYVKKREEKGK